MEEASQVRRAAREAVGETEPERLLTRLRRVLDGGSMVPGVLTIASARAVRSADGGDDSDTGGVDPDGEKSESNGGERRPVTDDTLGRRAAGVQLIYDGLRLTRTLADEEPWAKVSAEDDRTDADVAILAADVLVARGFFLLARTECATRAVETVRRFGRDQTNRRESESVERENTESEHTDRKLEADAIDLAVRCGTTAAGGEVPADTGDFATALAASTDGEFPPSGEFLSASVTDSLAALVSGNATNGADTLDAADAAGMSEGVPPATDG